MLDFRGRVSRISSVIGNLSDESCSQIVLYEKKGRILKR
jgi:hypothetical protein